MATDRPKKKKKTAKKKAAKKKAVPVKRPLTGKFRFRRRISRSKWIPKELIDLIWSSPQGTGHIDRFYFSNCTPDRRVVYLTAVVYEKGAPNPLEPAPERTDPIPSMQNGEVLIPGDPLECLRIDIVAHVEGPAGTEQYTYHCEIPEGAGENIYHVVVGVTALPEPNGDPASLCPFGIIVGSQGTRFPLQPPDWEITAI